MTKFKIIDLIDKVFISTTIFLLIFAWINFYIRDLQITFILTLIFSSACVFVLYYLLNKKREKKFLKQNIQKEIEENFFAFQLSSQQSKLRLIQKILSKKFNIFT